MQIHSEEQPWQSPGLRYHELSPRARQGGDVCRHGRSTRSPQSILAGRWLKASLVAWGREEELAHTVTNATQRSKMVSDPQINEVL